MQHVFQHQPYQPDWQHHQHTHHQYAQTQAAAAANAAAQQQHYGRLTQNQNGNGAGERNGFGGPGQGQSLGGQQGRDGEHGMMLGGMGAGMGGTGLAGQGPGGGMGNGIGVAGGEQNVSEENRKVLEWIAQVLSASSREAALLELSKKREQVPELALILWHSFGEYTS